MDTSVTEQHTERGGARVICVANQKGGTGKTATAGNLAAAWGAMGLAVLVCDLDPVFHMSRMFGIEDDRSGRSIYELLLDERSFEEVLERGVAPGVDLLPAARTLAGLATDLDRRPVRSEELVATALRPHFSGYDLVVIDTHPALDRVVVNAIVAADELMVPVSMLDPGAAQGLAELAATLQALREVGLERPITAVIRTYVDRRSIGFQSIAPAIPTLGLPIAQTDIPDRREITNAQIHQQPLVCWKPNCPAAEAYRALARELVAAAPAEREAA